ncbi:MAG: DUF3786 domain-containing protein [Clostridiales bacterium]|nr:DUF3786 domain-containing protein [Clostridiales bacterium]
MPVVENNKEMVPFEHYIGLFKNIDPEEAAQRCGVKYDAEAGVFTMRLLYSDYEITWPEFSIRSANEKGIALKSLPAQMLLIRFLLEGKASRGSGNFVTYREMPWGDVYLKPFTGRCLTRAAFTFGTRIEAFKAAIENSPFIPLKNGDAACQIEVMPGYDVRIIVWEGDDEFPPNAQILFSDNFPEAFSAEDRTVVGDIFITDLKFRM